MDYFDIVFPLPLRPLTYSWRSERGLLTPGMPVRAQVKRGIQQGIVLGKTAQQPSEPVKEIADVLSDAPLLPLSLINLLKWMAGYYLVPEGAVLRTMAIVGHLEKGSRSAKKREPENLTGLPERADLPPCPSEVLSPLLASPAAGRFRSFLFIAPTSRHEMACTLAAARNLRNVIVLVPERIHVERLLPALTDIAGERLAVFHGRLSERQRRESLTRVVSGVSDIVVGTRIAVFAPLRSVSLIAVLQEHNRAYKNLEGVRYHARDVAVMRGYLEKTTVLLSSPTPSLESFSNTAKGKYVLLHPHMRISRPRMEVVDMTSARKATPYLAQRSLQRASAALANNKKVMFLVNRKGYSLIQCSECNAVLSCPECRIPLILHRDRKILKCHYCRHREEPTDVCPACRGTRLEMVGAGTQRIAADVKRSLGVEPLRVDTDAIREDPTLKALSPFTGRDQVVVGTRAVRGKLGDTDAYHVGVFINPDTGLHLPDFRSAELLFQELHALSEHIHPDGRLIIQTRMPRNDVFRCIRHYDVRTFLARELTRRKALSYPPFSSFVTITVASGTDHDAPSVLSECVDEIEMIGPLHSMRRGMHVWKFILKSETRKRLHRYAATVIERLRNRRGVFVTVDVDPILL